MKLKQKFVMQLEAQLADRVDHRMLILPPLGAPAIDAGAVAEQTGWKTRWGPVYASDLPAFLARGARRDDTMKRARYALGERLDTGNFARME